MARIDSYSPDDNIIGSDKLIGTDNATGITKNFNLDSIKDWLNKSGGIRIAGQSNYRFQSLGSIPSDRIGQTISFESFGGDNTAFSDITEMVFSSVSASGSLTPEYISTLVDKLVLISDLTNSNNFGVYILTSFDEIVEEPTFYKAVLSFAYGNGTIKADESYGFTAYGLPNDGVTWGTIVGSLTDQTDLVNYVKAERPNYPISSPDGTSFIIVAGNDGTLAAIPPTSTAPSITTLPTISGTLNVGEILTATAGTTSGEPTPTTALQWQRSDNGTTGWADISGATGTTYLLAFNDEDKYIRVAQTEENILGTATANSASTGQIQPSIYDGILDLYGSAKAAYSLRLLARNYNGYSIKIRRDSDQELQDIGFSVNGQLDVLAIENFCGSANGYVHTWYDQTGANHDLTQSSASAQPLIYNGTAVEQENNNPAIVYSGTQYLLDSTISSYQPNNIYIVLNKLSSTAYTYDGGSTGTARNSLGDSNWIYAGASLSGAWSNPNKQTLHNALYNSTASYAYQDSLLKAEGNAGPYPLIGFTLGSRYSLSGYYFGSIQEVIVWNENKINERTGIETNINDFYNIY